MNGNTTEKNTVERIEEKKVLCQNKYSMYHDRRYCFARKLLNAPLRSHTHSSQISFGFWFGSFAKNNRIHIDHMVCVVEWIVRATARIEYRHHAYII